MTTKVRRYCTRCQSVKDHEVEVNGFRQTQRCEGCESETARYDLRKRTWAGV